jgi:hypothetical protein
MILTGMPFRMPLSSFWAQQTMNGSLSCSRHWGRDILSSPCSREKIKAKRKAGKSVGWVMRADPPVFRYRLYRPVAEGGVGTGRIIRSKKNRECPKRLNALFCLFYNVFFMIRRIFTGPLQALLYRYKDLLGMPVFNE